MRWRCRGVPEDGLFPAFSAWSENLLIPIVISLVLPPNSEIKLVNASVFSVNKTRWSTRPKSPTNVVSRFFPYLRQSFFHVGGHFLMPDEGRSRIPEVLNQVPNDFNSEVLRSNIKPLEEKQGCG